LDYVLGVRNLIRGLEGEIRAFKLGQIWDQASPGERRILLKEFPMEFGEFAYEDKRKAKQTATEHKVRAWLRRHQVTRQILIVFYAVLAPYLYLSSRIRWMLSVGRFKAEDAIHPAITVATAKQVAPLLRELFPNKTDQERASLLVLFSAAHDGRPLVSLGDSHIEELTRTLRYYIRLGNRELGIGSPQIGDECPGCQEFKATMLELETGLKFKRDEQGRLASPVAIDETPEVTDSDLLSAIRVIAKRSVEEDWDQYARAIQSDREFWSASDAERLRDAYGTGWMSYGGQPTQDWASMSPEENAALLDAWAAFQEESLTDPEFGSIPDIQRLHSAFVRGWTARATFSDGHERPGSPGRGP
jgi:hypothetical protein